VIWDFIPVFGKATRFYLNQVEPDFDVSLDAFSALKHIRVYLEISSVSTVRKIFFFAKKDRQIKKGLIGVALG